jgi:hypothetical protein
MPDFNRIQIVNNFLPPKIQLAILEILRKPGWNLGHLPAIEGDSTPPSKLWHMNNLERFTLFSEVIFKVICKRFQTRFKIKRIYANAQIACQKGDIHTDDGDLTFLYYPLQEWRPEWGGSLMFYKGAEVAECVSYVPNRAVMFPAKIIHGAEAPSKDYDGMRVSVAWKLLLPEDNLQDEKNQ